MYDLPELRAAHDALWSALARRLNAKGVTGVPSFLTHGLGHFDVWRHAHLLLGQGCEYPLATAFRGRVRTVATPRYAAPGCAGASYRSAIVVRADDQAQTLADLRNRRCAINESSSNSGMNLLRATLAPLAGGRPFFDSVVLTGSHRNSVTKLAEGEADVAAIDCVSFAHFQRLYPTQTAALRILCWSPPSPSLPFITSAHTDDVTLGALRSALADLFTDSTLESIRGQLLLDGVDLEPGEEFAEVLDLREQAISLGYPSVC
jgi:ABC-type phosphate/phosphonate transport system substrate-binding protein